MFGLYTIDNFHFVVLENIFESSLEIHELYDLKGSTHGRYNESGVGVLKDLNLNKNNRTFKVGPMKTYIVKELRSDSNVCFYHLLIYLFIY